MKLLVVSTLILLLSACTQKALMVHPETGDKVLCESGVNLFGYWAQRGELKSCVNGLRAAGYRKSEED